MKRSVLNRTFKTERFIRGAAAAKNRSCALGLREHSLFNKRTKIKLSAANFYYL